MKKRLRVISGTLLVCMLYQLFFPTVAYALTGGPSQPEVESFEPVGTTEMVDLFSGDFNYNIPLMDVDGYPINIAYHSGVTMDQEASWVGLGWNLNPGVVNRNMRGLPDDFMGDEIQKLQYVKPNRTYGANLGVGIEIFGKEKDQKGKILKDSITKKALLNKNRSFSLNYGLGINYNNYTGLGIESRITPSISAGNVFKTPILSRMGFNASIELASSSKDGFTIKPAVGMSMQLRRGRQIGEGTNITQGISVGTAINSRSGVKALTLSHTVSVTPQRTKWVKDKDSKSGDNKAIVSALKAGIQGGSTISYGTQTYTPAIGMRFENANISFTAKLGTEKWWLNPHASITGYYAGQAVAETRATRKAYGALYAQNYPDDNAMLDYNREHDGTVSAQNPTLAIPVFTHDLYSVSAQGMGGMFRTTRNDIPVVHDPNMQNIAGGKSLGAEYAIGNVFKAGLNPAFNYSEVRSGAWRENNDLLQKMSFVPKSLNEPSYEPVYFKNVGEKTAVNTSLLSYTDLDATLRPYLDDRGRAIDANDAYIKGDRLQKKNASGGYDDVNIVNAPNKRTERDKRNLLFSYKTVAEAAYCLETDISFTTIDEDNNLGTGSVSRQNSKTAANHITEVSVTNNGGMRYVYGIPAYNNFQYDISFTNAKNPDGGGTPAVHCEEGLVEYANDLNLLDPDLQNRSFRGNDHGYTMTKTPAYAHSYLLTAVLSPDYVDVNNNGPSEEDYGTYTKLSYYKTSDAYKWRVPFKKGHANYNEALKSDKSDDQASVMYGEKELWLVRKIEGKNHYAVFHISKRTDGMGAADENGGREGTASFMYKLDKIELFSKRDEAVPIKTVHFLYNDKLCRGVGNSFGTQDGKLTLLSIYFTYGNSDKGRLNSYEFKYEGLNPNYNIKAYDRWGNYKPNSLEASETNGNTVDCNRLSNSDFPYTEQDKEKTDAYASAWSLTSIVLPSGGVIRIEYEADDYAYVQDKRAMQMTKIKGFRDYSADLANPDYTAPDLSADNKLFSDTDPKECIFFDLPASLKTRDPEYIKRGLREATGNILYFNCLVNLTSEIKNEFNREYVRGYTEVEDVGVINMQGDHPVGWVKVKLKDDGQSHPIAKSAWQYARMYLPHLVYPGSNLRKKADGSDVVEAMIRGILGFAFDAIDMLDGVNDKLRGWNYGKHVTLDHSWIRINNLTGFKLGGGVRVKKLLLDDNWNSMSSSGKNMSYGQEYDYTIKEEFDGEERIISSGVASYEPAAGNDENPLKRPVAYTNENIGIPNDDFYSEEPFGESYFPSPEVGYSRVGVKNIVPENAQVTKNGTGKVVHEFYTARDFPVFTSRTEIADLTSQASPIFKIIGFRTEQHTSMVQGFQIELNDMHGKVKAMWNYDQAHVNSYETREAFSGMKYEYGVEDPDARAKKLKNEFQVINTNNQITTAQVGVEVDMVLDTRKQFSETYSGGLAMNLESTVVPPLPSPVVTFFAWPDFSSEYTSFKSAVSVRVINRFGLLKKTIAFEEGASVTSENLLLDAESGEVLLTRTFNEYKDPVYNYNMPAYWVYNGMGPAYQNTGMEVKIGKQNTDPFNYKIIVNGYYLPLTDYLVNGDEVYLVSSNPAASLHGEKLWVLVRDGGTYLIDETGAVKDFDVSEEYTLKVIRSGRRNMQTTPVLSLASLASPISGSSINTSVNKVLNAQTATFKEHWGNNLPMAQRCGDYHYYLELVGILNFILQTHLLYWNDGPQTIPVDTTAAGSAVYKNSLLKKAIDAGGNQHEFNFVPTLPGLGKYSEFRFVSVPATTPAYTEVLSFALLPESFNPVKVKLISYEPASFGAFVKVLLENNTGDKLASTIAITSTLVTSCNCVQSIGETKNPFLTGNMGNWRKHQSYVYHDSRTQTGDARKDGIYASYSPFWSYASGWKQNSSLSKKWTLTGESTKYNSAGVEIENKDALGRYSAAVYGYNQTMPVAVAGNAAYTQIGFNGFEEVPSSQGTCLNEHLGIKVLSPASVVSNVAHTGAYSLKLGADVSMLGTFAVKAPGVSSQNGEIGYIVDENSANGILNPQPGKYVVGAWVKVGNDKKKLTYNDPNGCQIKLDVVRRPAGAPADSTDTYLVRPSGPIIEGWQRIEYVFTIPADAYQFKITLKGVGTIAPVEDTWFDDLRVQPFDSKMKTYVYDPKTLRLTAELDENNFASFYEYDAEGQLIRVKKETERGIMTIKESRSSQHKKFEF